MKKTVIAVIAVCLLLPFGAQSQGRRPSAAKRGTIRRYVEQAAMGGTLRDAQFGVLAMTVGGDTLVAWESNRLLVPASNKKLITTGIALHELGSDYRFHTQLAYSGTVSGGVLHGDLYIVGGGDPTIGVTDPEATPLKTLFGEWKQILDKAGIRRIKGRIVGDGRLFDGPIEQDTWMYQDIGTYYGTGGNGLGFYRNILDAEVTPGAEAGDSVRVTISYPQVPWLHLTASARTTAKGSGNRLLLFDTDLAPVADMRGTMAADSSPLKLECSNKFGALTCAHYFRNYLVGEGVTVEGIADITASGRLRSEKFEDSGLPAESLHTLGGTPSPSLLQIVARTNARSDNYYAEALFRTLSRLKTGSADYAVCPEAEVRALYRLGLNPSKIRIADGSGLSRDNWISPYFLCTFLQKMTQSPVFGDFLSTLNHPGAPGYANRLKNESPELKERIFYKSGAMSGVRCYSGYVVPSEGGTENVKNMIVFSVMVNNCTAPLQELLPIIDRIIALIAMEN